MQDLGLDGVGAAQREGDIEPVEEPSGITADWLKRLGCAGCKGDPLGLRGEVADETVELGDRKGHRCGACVAEGDGQCLAGD